MNQPPEQRYLVNKTFDEIKIGDSASLTRTLMPEDVKLFAILTGDVNPAVVDPSYSESGMFREVIAHGMWSGSLISTVLGTQFPGPGTILVDQTLHFARPVTIGDTITITVTARQKFEHNYHVIFDCVCNNQEGLQVVRGTAEVLAPMEKVSRLQEVHMPEIRDAIAAGRLKPDNDILSSSGDVKVTKAAVEPVWWLPGIAERFGVKETDLRRTLFEQTGGMYTELVTRMDLELFLPPIGGSTIYFFGDVQKLGKPETRIACRLHDECNGSDVFGSDICTCRPYLAHGIEICIEMAQKGGVGVVIYNRKEGRALGEVTKFLVYNARKRQPGGDSAAQYFNRTECVAGVQDMRFQELMPDVFHWLGISRIDRFASMSNMKSDALREQGIEVVEQVPIPDELIPADAQVEMDAKKAAGYFTPKKPAIEELAKPKGRGLDE